MKSMMRRTTFREIKNTFGRFAAIMAIIALGVGFFSGLKMTKPDMMNTISKFLDEGNFYDLHLLSTLGYTDDDVDSFAGEKDVLYAEGGYSLDVLYKNQGENDRVLKTMSVPENINKLMHETLVAVCDEGDDRAVRLQADAVARHQCRILRADNDLAAAQSLQVPSA